MVIGGKKLKIKSFFINNFNINQSIRTRIIFSFELMIIIIVLFLEILAFTILYSYYYSGAEQILKDRITLTSDFLNKYVSYADIKEKAGFLMKNFLNPENKIYLIQVIDSDYNVITDSNDFSYFQQVKSRDVINAFNDLSIPLVEINEYTGEKIMAISMPLKQNNKIEGVVRYSTSMENIDRSIRNYCFIGLFIGIVVISLSFFVAIIISKSIVFPIKKLTNVATSMAEGDFDIVADKIYDDEIGQLTETLNFMASEIKRTDKIKNNFISSISHELRTPLTSIKGWGETLLEDSSNPEELNMGLKIISDESERLGKIVEELLDFSRIENNSMRANKSVIDPKQIFRNVYSQFYPRKGNIEFNCTLRGEDVLIFADSNRIRQIFINVITNAIKFTPEGGAVILLAEGTEDRIRFFISDTGIGIPKSDLSHIKEKFFKSNLNYPGSGLGLSIVEELLKIHSGTIEIFSEIGKGTTIIITFPKYKKETADKEVI